MSSDAVLVKIDRFGQRFQRRGAVQGAVRPMTVADGEFAAVVGRSGSGKTTLMSLLGALEQPTSGMIFVDGQDITRLSPGELVRYRGRKIGFVFQSYNLVPNLTATENVMLPMEFTGAAKAERRTRAAQLLEQVELNYQTAELIMPDGTRPTSQHHGLKLIRRTNTLACTSCTGRFEPKRRTQRHDQAPIALLIMRVGAPSWRSGRLA